MIRRYWNEFARDCNVSPNFVIVLAPAQCHKLYISRPSLFTSLTLVPWSIPAHHTFLKRTNLQTSTSTTASFSTKLHKIFSTNHIYGCRSYWRQTESFPLHDFFLFLKPLPFCYQASYLKSASFFWFVSIIGISGRSMWSA